MTARQSILLVLLLTCFIGSHARAGVAATRPVAQIAKSYVALDDRDPLRRYEARADLMGLSRADLRTLLDVVKANQPMAPSQALALRDIVLQVWLATEPLESVPGQGFLGLSGLRGADSGANVVDPQDPAAGPGGVVFDTRTPGFCSYRWLQDGDVILSFGPVGNTQRVLSFTRLATLVKETPAGAQVEMRVLRGGGVVTLHFPLDARPVAASLDGPNAGNINLFRDTIEERVTRAEAYWRATFAPLMNPDFT